MVVDVCDNNVAEQFKYVTDGGQGVTGPGRLRVEIPAVRQSRISAGRARSLSGRRDIIWGHICHQMRSSIHYKVSIIADISGRCDHGVQGPDFDHRGISSLPKGNILNRKLSNVKYDMLCVTQTGQNLLMLVGGKLEEQGFSRICFRVKLNYYIRREGIVITRCNLVTTELKVSSVKIEDIWKKL